MICRPADSVGNTREPPTIDLERAQIGRSIAVRHLRTNPPALLVPQAPERLLEPSPPQRRLADATPDRALFRLFPLRHRRSVNTTKQRSTRPAQQWSHPLSPPHAPTVLPRGTMDMAW